MGSALLRVVRTEMLLRLGHWIGGCVGLGVVAGCVNVAAPVFINGDPVTYGPWGAVFGLGAGVVPGIVVGVAVVVALLGSDLDRGMVAERLRHGTQPALLAWGNLLCALLAALAVLTVTVFASGIAAAADVVTRSLLGVEVTVLAPGSRALAAAVVAPVALIVLVVLAWLGVVAARSATRACVVFVALIGSFILALLSLPAQLQPLLVVHPLGCVWRAMSETSIGAEMPGALTGAAGPYVAATVAWMAVLVLAATRGLRRLGLD